MVDELTDMFGEGHDINGFEHQRPDPNGLCLLLVNHLVVAGHHDDRDIRSDIQEFSGEFCFCLPEGESRIFFFINREIMERDSYIKACFCDGEKALCTILFA